MPSAKDLTFDNLKTTILIAGAPTTGKSRFLSTLPKPIMVLDTDGGIASYAGLDGVDYEDFTLEETDDVKELKGNPDPSVFKAWTKFMYVLHQLRHGTYNDGKKYKTIVIDSLTTLNVMAHIHCIWKDPDCLTKKVGLIDKIYIARADLVKDAMFKFFSLDAVRAIAAHTMEVENSKTKIVKLEISAPGALQTFIPAKMDLVLFSDRITKMEGGKSNTKYIVRMKPSGQFAPRVRMNGFDANKLASEVENDFDEVTKAIEIARGA